MNIVICEDTLEYLDYIKSCIREVISVNSLKCNLALATSSPYEVINYINENSLITIYFLDISLNSRIDGFSIASKIREKDWNSFIVFITAHRDKVNLTFEYKLEVMDYIVKGHVNTFQKIKECILLAYSRLDKSNDNLMTLSNKYSKICIKKDDIYLIESIKQSHKVTYYYNNGKFETRGVLKDIIRELGPNFIRCNKAVIINKSRIKSVNSIDRSITLDNNITCYYSKGLCKDDII